MSTPKICGISSIYIWGQFQQSCSSENFIFFERFFFEYFRIFVHNKEENIFVYTYWKTHFKTLNFHLSMIGEISSWWKLKKKNIISTFLTTLTGRVFCEKRNKFNGGLWSIRRIAPACWFGSMNLIVPFCKTFFVIKCFGMSFDLVNFVI